MCGVMATPGQQIPRYRRADRSMDFPGPGGLGRMSERTSHARTRQKPDQTKPAPEPGQPLVEPRNTTMSNPQQQLVARPGISLSPAPRLAHFTGPSPLNTAVGAAVLQDQDLASGCSELPPDRSGQSSRAAILSSGDCGWLRAEGFAPGQVRIRAGRSSDFSDTT
jgi:hypothetical protein